MFQLELAYADHQAGNTIGMIGGQKPLAKLAGLVDVAIGEHGEERAAEQIGIARIELEHVEIVRCRRRRIALGSGMARSQIAAGCILG